MVRLLHVPILAVGLLGCRGPQAPTAGSSPALVGIAAPAGEPPCRLHAESWSGDVMLEQGGPLFARVIGVSASIDLPRRSTSSALPHIASSQVAHLGWEFRSQPAYEPALLRYLETIFLA